MNSYTLNENFQQNQIIYHQNFNDNFLKNEKKKIFYMSINLWNSFTYN